MQPKCKRKKFFKTKPNFLCVCVYNSHCAPSSDGHPSLAAISICRTLVQYPEPHWVFSGKTQMMEASISASVTVRLIWFV